MKRFTLEEGGLEAFRAVVAGLAKDERLTLDARCTPTVLGRALQIPDVRIWGLELNCRGLQRYTIAPPSDLFSLKVQFPRSSELEFATEVVWRCRGLRELSLTEIYDAADPSMLFGALGVSNVIKLHLISNLKTKDHLAAYLRKDRLEELQVEEEDSYANDSTWLLEALRGCTRLRALKLSHFTLQPRDFAPLPQSVTLVRFYGARFAPGFDWGFVDHVDDLEILLDSGVTGHALRLALVRRLERGTMARLSLQSDVHILRFDRIGKLEISSGVNEEMVQAIAAAIYPGSHLRALNIRADLGPIQAHLVPALRHPECSLTYLELRGIDAGIKQVQDRFRHRKGLLILLQGQQVRRLYNPLHRLPVEMFRLVGQTLL